MKLKKALFIEKEQRTFLQTYNRLPIIPKEALGHLIWDNDGVCYYDFLSGLSVNLLGHCHPRINDAINSQLKKFSHLSNYFYQEPQLDFATKLKSMSDMDKIFLANSGTEANEGAIKLCRKWGYNRNKTEIIAFSGGFHGRTYGSLSLMDKPNYKDGMGPWLPDMQIVEYNNCEALEAAANEKTAGVFLEFLQGEGGLQSATDEFVATINRLKEKHNFLLIVDEVQTGAGRTGKFFAFEHYSVRPDIITMAKGIGGGLPLGAILTTENLANIWSRNQHGSTFGGNALACVAGLVVLEELERGLIDVTLAVGKYFYNALLELKAKFPDKIKEIRGQGLMLGIVLDFEANILAKALLEEHNIITSSVAGNVLRLLPPLIISDDDIALFISSLAECLNNL